MAEQYKKAPEVKIIADDLMEKYHHHLIGVPVFYVFHEQAKEKKGRTVLATASKQGGLMALMARNMLPQHDFGTAKDAEFFLIDVAHDAWEKLTAEQQTALVDHELSHCVLDEKDNLGIVGHDAV